MGTGNLEAALLLAVVGVSLGLMLLRPRGLAEVWWIGGGVAVLLALRLVQPAQAARAAGAGADVYLFLTGMMLLSELARECGVFDWVASATVRAAQRRAGHGSAARLFLLVYAVGVVVTVLLSNDATAVVLTPAVLAVTRQAEVQRPLPYLVACAMIANAASFVLPISNPANLVVFHAGMPPLLQWLGAFALPSLLSIVATYAALRWLFRGELRGDISGEIASKTDRPVKAVALTSDGRLVLVGLGVMVAVLLGASALRQDLGLPACVSAAVLTAVVCWRARRGPLPLLRQIGWSTLLLVAGLFVMVDAVEGIGALRLTQRWLAWAAALGPHAGPWLAGFAVAVGNNLVNNLPLGLLAGATLHAAHAANAANATQGAMANAVLIGVDLGPNLSVTGSLATILWLLALRREHVEVSAGRFLRLGLVAMPLALAAALAGSMLLAAPR